MSYREENFKTIRVLKSWKPHLSWTGRSRASRWLNIFETKKPTTSIRDRWAAILHHPLRSSLPGTGARIAGAWGSFFAGFSKSDCEAIYSGLTGWFGVWCLAVFRWVCDPWIHLEVNFLSNLHQISVYPLNHIVSIIEEPTNSHVDHVWQKDAYECIWYNDYHASYLLMHPEDLCAFPGFAISCPSPNYHKLPHWPPREKIPAETWRFSRLR